MIRTQVVVAKNVLVVVGNVKVTFPSTRFLNTMLEMVVNFGQKLECGVSFVKTSHEIE